MLFPTELADSALVLDASIPLGRRGNAAVAALMRNGLQASVGLEVLGVDRLVSVTGEQHIVEFCPSDRNRFADVDACRTWASKQRAFVSITDVASSALLAYGWSGPDTNKHVPGADITTAYRVTRFGQAATKRIRESGEKDFRLGIQLGETVIASAVYLFGASPDAVSLETWASNGAARHLYELLGFVQLDSAPNEPATRPTFEPLGSQSGLPVGKEPTGGTRSGAEMGPASSVQGANADGRAVRLDPGRGDDPSRRVIDDERCFYVLRNYQ